MKKTVKKPGVISLDDGIKLRTIRGPRDSDNLYYWGAIVYDPETGNDRRLFCMWSKPELMIAEVAKRKADGTLFDSDKKSSTPKTVHSLLDEWNAFVDTDLSLSSATQKTYRYSSKYIKSYLPDIPLLGLNSEILDGFKVKFLNDYSERTYNLCVRTFKTAWFWSCKRGYVSGHLPLEKISDPEDAAEKYTPSEKQITALFAALKCKPWVKVALTICRECGSRNGELSFLKWKDIDFGRNLITLDGKTGKREIPMTVKLSACLLEWSEKKVKMSDNIFGVSEDRVLKTPNEKLGEASEASGIDRRITIHSLRRAFIARMRRRGISVKDAATITGHSPEMMLRIYDESSEDDLKAAMMKLELTLDEME